jgi:hypothetical protein
MEDTKEIKDLRILHILSCVKWIGDTFNSNADANWKVALKTITFLPNAHHYILCPKNHNIKLRGKNITFIPYNYPKSVQLNRGMFDYRQIRFSFKRIDVDYVFNHQPELTYNIQQWFSTNRYFDSPKYFGFYHWIDCNASRGSTSSTPKFYMRQLEAMHLGTANFIHSDISLDYLLKNFSRNPYKIDASSLIKDVYYMPLTSKIDTKPTSFVLPNKKILVFNHRWTNSSGIKRFLEYIEDLGDDYLVWITDEDCDYKANNVIVKHLKYSDYAYVLQNCYASLCFIDGYTTWNLSAQDSLVLGKPILCYEHPTLKKVLGEEYGGYFKSKDEFYHLLNNLPQTNHALSEHDFIFELQLKSAILNTWKTTKNPPKDAQQWIDNINLGIVTKLELNNLINPSGRMSNTAHYVRRYMLHNGIRDDINSPFTKYYVPNNPLTIKKDLFSDL